MPVRLKDASCCGCVLQQLWPNNNSVKLFCCSSHRTVLPLSLREKLHLTPNVTKWRTNHTAFLPLAPLKQAWDIASLIVDRNIRLRYYDTLPRYGHLLHCWIASQPLFPHNPYRSPPGQPLAKAMETTITQYSIRILNILNSSAPFRFDW